jgi:hypothetical protein
MRIKYAECCCRLVLCQEGEKISVFCWSILLQPRKKCADYSSCRYVYIRCVIPLQRLVFFLDGSALSTQNMRNVYSSETFAAGFFQKRKEKKKNSSFCNVSKLSTSSTPSAALLCPVHKKMLKKKHGLKKKTQGSQRHFRQHVVILKKKKPATTYL